ncbi:hypothetical protein GVAV_002728 [Gurleya vavrai]
MLIKRIVLLFFKFLLISNTFATTQSKNQRKQTEEILMNNQNSDIETEEQNFQSESESKKYFGVENNLIGMYLDIINLQESKYHNIATNSMTDNFVANENYLNCIINPNFESNIEIYKIFYDPSKIISKIDTSDINNVSIIEDVEKLLLNIDDSKISINNQLENFEKIKYLLKKIIEFTISNMKKSEDIIQKTNILIELKQKERIAIENSNPINGSHQEIIKDEDLVEKLLVEIRYLKDKNYNTQQSVLHYKRQLKNLEIYTDDYTRMIDLYKSKIIECDEKSTVFKKVIKILSKETLSRQDYMNDFIKFDLKDINADLLTKTEFFSKLIEKNTNLIIEKHHEYKNLFDTKKTFDNKRLMIKKDYYFETENYAIIKFSFNSDENYIYVIEKMHEVINEIKTIFAVIEIIKIKIKILEAHIDTNSYYLSQLDIKKNAHQHEPTFDNMETRQIDAKNNLFEGFLYTDETEKNLEKNIERIFPYRRFIKLQNEIDKKLGIEKKIVFLNDYCKKLNKKNGMFFEMCQSELIFLVKTGYGQKQCQEASEV